MELTLMIIFYVYDIEFLTLYELKLRGSVLKLLDNHSFQYNCNLTEKW